MAVLDGPKENFTIESCDAEGINSLREERRRTGRYVAAGTAIFLSLLGVYQALARGTPEYAALFLPAVIMFVYVFWILYASRARKKVENLEDSIKIDEEFLTEVAINEENSQKAVPENCNPKKQTVCRTYSVA